MTDYANGVNPSAPTPVEELARLLHASGGILTGVLAEALPLIDADALRPVGTHYSWE